IRDARRASTVAHFFHASSSWLFVNAFLIRPIRSIPKAMITRMATTAITPSPIAWATSSFSIILPWLRLTEHIIYYIVAYFGVNVNPAGARDFLHSPDEDRGRVANSAADDV